MRPEHSLKSRGDPCHSGHNRASERPFGSIAGLGQACLSAAMVTSGKTGKAGARAARNARLAAALRENLKRRKRQARQRSEQQAPASGRSVEHGERDSEPAADAPDFRRNQGGE
jgi:hypothetical protein